MGDVRLHALAVSELFLFLDHRSVCTSVSNVRVICSNLWENFPYNPNGSSKMMNLKFDHARIVKAINGGMNKAHESVQTVVTAIVLLQIENEGEMTAKAMRDEVTGAATASGFEAFRKLYSAANAVYRDKGEVFANRIVQMNEARTFENVLALVHGLIWKPKTDKNANDTRFTCVDDIRKAYAKPRVELSDDEQADRLYGKIDYAINNAMAIMTIERLDRLAARVALIRASMVDGVTSAEALANVGLDIATPDDAADDTAISVAA